MKQAWPLARLGDILIREDRFEPRDHLIEYQFAGTYSYAKGIFISERKAGASFGLPKIQRIKENDFVYCKIMAWEGAFGIVPKEADNCVMSGAFVAYSVVSSKVLPSFLGYFFKLKHNWQKIGQQSSGTNVRRQSLHPDNFENYKIAIPPIEEQQRIVARIDTVQQQLQEADRLRSSIVRDIASLLAVQFQDTLVQTKWLPMRDVAPLIRRNVQLEQNRQYKELGARSFGKGLFVKTDFDADAATWEKPVWIKSGDIVFSNIKAWEGAIGVAKPEHDGYIASHRYLTAVVKPKIALPEYLLYYLLSEVGLNAVNEASPGTADRNRTTKRSALEKIRVPVPPIAVQRQFVNLKNTLEQTAAIRANQMISVDAMLPALCNRLL